jgi:hypothetical protein
MKTLLFIYLFLACSLNIFGQANNNQSNQNGQNQTNYTRPEAGERFKKYVKGTIGPTAWIGIVGSATWKQIRNSPREWERNTRGFGKRLADSFGRTFIGNTVTYGLDETLRLDSSFYKSSKRDFKSKLSNAVLSAVTARTREGKRVIGLPRLVGSYTSGIIANEVWRPRRYSWKDGLKDGTISIPTRMLFNLIREMF